MHPIERADTAGGQWLHDAIAQRASITLQVKTPSGWAVWKSRLLSGEGDRLTIAHPQGPQIGEADFVVGQTVGIALRRNHGKCLFESEVLSRESQTGTVVLRWPEDVQELQRRLYSRARVPDHVTIPVNLSRLSPDGSAEIASTPRRGILLDLSGGGMSVAVPADARNKWRRGDLMRCLVPLEPAREPCELTACLRFVEKAPQGHLRMGMQFVGLEASADGRATLKSIARAAGRFRGSARHASQRF